MFLSIEINKNKEAKHEEAANAVPTKSIGGAVVRDKYSTDDGPASPAEAMVNALENTLGGGPEMLRCIVGYVGTGGSPNSGMSDALHEFERQHHPWIAKIGDVEKA